YCVTYNYDQWGKLLSQSGTTSWAQKMMNLNPLRYRGYVYDSDSGLYYLQSRYYDPTTCRFINEDGQINKGILGTNLFAYCDNEPVSFSDPRGQDIHAGVAAYWYYINTYCGGVDSDINSGFAYAYAIPYMESSSLIFNPLGHTDAINYIYKAFPGLHVGTFTIKSYSANGCSLILQLQVGYNPQKMCILTYSEGFWGTKINGNNTYLGISLDDGFLTQYSGISFSGKNNIVSMGFGYSFFGCGISIAASALFYPSIKGNPYVAIEIVGKSANLSGLQPIIQKALVAYGISVGVAGTIAIIITTSVEAGAVAVCVC
ncbi:MAG: RHS repeat-associated core domain-containing protein, partial [Bacillota bacterium]|nr:RHS repeat-associated core domain-containing protein [Bacillota bacterium]